MFTDAVGLVMYYTKRASSLQHSDALKIKSFLTHTLSSILYYPRYMYMYAYTVHASSNCSYIVYIGGKLLRETTFVDQ